MEEKAKKFWKEEEPSKVEKRRPKPPQVNIEAEKMRNGLAKLVITVIELLRELMEKQAIRRIEAGSLSEEQIENLGTSFMKLKEEVEKLKNYFELEDEDLNIDLGPLQLREDEADSSYVGKASAVEILDRLLAKGVVLKGDVVLSVAEVDLVSLNLGLLLANIDKAKELYATPPSTALLEQEIKRLQEENERLKKLNKL